MSDKMDRRIAEIMAAKVNKQRAEIERLREEHRAEVEKLRAEIERLHKAHQAVCEGWDLLREKNERLRAQMQQIRERLYLAAGHAAAAALLSEEAHQRALEGKP